MRLNNIFIGLLSIFVFYGCGGGGGGSSEPDIPQAASLSFSSSATEVDKGDSITLSWSTSGLTSCSAFSDPNNTFSGSIPLSGSQEVTITSAGNHNFLINCSGNNGNKAIKDIDVVAYNTVDIQGTIYYSTDSTGALSLNNEQVNSQTGRDFPSEEDVFNYLCYAPVSETLTIEYDKSLSTILSNVDIDNDEIPDANLKGPFSSVYKNIASNSFGFNEVPTDPVTLSENFTPDLFLFDLHESLEKNIDLDNDGIADLNITRNFNSTSGTLSPSEIIIFNIQIDPENNPDLILNKTEFNKDIQFAEFELLNFDSNYDGIADTNIDTDGDGIAERRIDEDNDCFADYSYVDGEGVTVEGAEIRLAQAIRDNTTGDWVSFEEERIATTDADGVFKFEDVMTGTSHRIWIDKELKDKKIHTIRMIEVPNEDISSWKMGAFPLTSAPIIMGYEIGINGEGIYKGWPGFPYSGEFGFFSPGAAWEWNVGDKFDLKLLFLDPNKLDISRKVPAGRNADGSRKYEFIVADRPETTESGYSEFLFEYELKQEGCFNITLNSFSASWNDEGSQDDYCQPPTDNQLSNIFYFEDDMIFNNSDTRGLYSRNIDNIAFVTFNNLNRDESVPPTGYTVESAEINSITYEHPDDYEMWASWYFCTSDFCPISGNKENIIIEPKEIDIPLVVKINASKSSTDVEGYLTTFWKPNNFEGDNVPERIIGNEATFNFSEDSLPKYYYQIIGGVCITENEPDGYCRENPMKEIYIEVEPLGDKQPTKKQDINLVINDENFAGYNCMWSSWQPCQNFDQIFQVGDTLIIELSGADPNGLATEFKVSPPKQKMSDWKPETTLDTYVIEEEDRGNTIGIGFCWRNNDGVANSWEPVGESYSELDGCHSVRLRVSE